MAVALIIAIVISAISVDALSMKLDAEEPRQYPEGVFWRG